MDPCQAPYHTDNHEMICDRLTALYRGSESITIGRHELTPYRDVSIVNADDLERTDDDQRIHRYIQKGLPRIPRLRADWEELWEAATPIDHLWNKERELTRLTPRRLRNCFSHRILSLQYGIED
ncbi:hypothetical protein scyTo_0017245 [Scyliorhinus torazame]|uniref:Uncharacterized protein n=1 Tax=Scyliorhinus torazame TaxID=75743 RepID=A0A401Q5H1_SCYTO|nr:hypothetical protein [Scyliorhinus torazame]